MAQREKEGAKLENHPLYPVTATDPLSPNDRLVYGLLLGTSLTLPEVKYGAGLSEERTEASLWRLEEGGLVRQSEHDEVIYYNANWSADIRNQMPETAKWLLTNGYILA